MSTKTGFVLVCCVLMGSVMPAGQRDAAVPSPPPALSASHEEAVRWAADTLQTLTLDQKVGQMICDQIRGAYVADGTPAMASWLRLVRDYGIGGVVVYGGTPHDTAVLLNRLQRESRLPILVAADFEAGPGQQIIGASEFPGNMALSAIGSEALSYAVGKAGAAEGRAIGIHLTYSPVVDVSTRPENPVLSVRSFGGDLDLLGRMAGAYIRGYQENGMLATAKHYPGRGDVDLIPGTEFTVNRKPAAQVEAEDLRAFRYAIDAGVAFVMSEHITVPSLTAGSDLPASVDRTLARTWLRGTLGFTGVLTSDDLWYAKMTDRFGAERTGVLSVLAGHDVLLKPADAVKTLAAVIAAVKSGEIPAAQIDESVGRILYWKARLNLHRNRFVDESKIRAVVGSPAHGGLVRSVVERSLTVLTNHGFFPASGDRTGTVLHLVVQKQEHDIAAVEIAATIRAAFRVPQTFVLRPSTDPRMHRQALEAAALADTVIVSLLNPRTTYQDNGPLRAADLACLREIVSTRPQRTVVMSYGNPYLVESLADASAFVVGYGEGGFYGNQIAYADAFVRLLKGEIGATARLPVRVSERFPIGAGVVVAGRPSS